VLHSPTRARRASRALVAIAITAATAHAPAAAAADQEPPPAPIDTCAAGATGAVARRVSPSIVQVEAPGGVAHGFVFGSDRFVVVPLAVVETGRGIVVHGPSGDVRRPTVVVVDRDHGLALLELATPLPGARALEPSTAPIELGTSVLLFSGVDLVSRADLITPGIISRVLGDRFVTSVRPGHASWGGPLVDCDGRVLGVSMAFEGDHALRVDVLPALVARAPSAPEYSSGWSAAHPGAGTMFSFGRRGPWLGMYLGNAVVEEDRVELSGRAAVSVLVDPNQPGEPVESGVRVAADMRIGYRFLLSDGFLPVYFAPTIGAIGGWEGRWRSERRADATAAGCADASTCTQESPPRYLGNRAWIDPVLGAAIRLAPAELGYSLQLDLRYLPASTHTLSLGFQL
jgi:hypothetical protein